MISQEQWATTPLATASLEIEQLQPATLTTLLPIYLDKKYRGGSVIKKEIYRKLV